MNPSASDIKRHDQIIEIEDDFLGFMDAVLPKFEDGREKALIKIKLQEAMFWAFEAPMGNRSSDKRGKRVAGFK